MSLENRIESTCACGGQIATKVRKPTWFENKVATAKCPKCQSTYIFTAFIDKKSEEREIKLNISFINMTKEHKDMMRAKLLDKEAGLNDNDSQVEMEYKHDIKTAEIQRDASLNER